jgi:hypothetical protein
VNQQAVSKLDLEVMGVGWFELDDTALDGVIEDYPQCLGQQCLFVLELLRHSHILIDCQYQA